MHRVEHPAYAPTDTAQAVLAFTGSGGPRVRAAIERAQELDLPVLVSGVAPHLSDLPLFAKHYALAPDRLTDLSITLGTRATTTEENGREAALWARRHAYKTLIIVTSSFHMERSLIELHRSMPDIETLPMPVPTLILNPGDWWKDSRVRGLIAEEWVTMRIAGLRAWLMPHKTVSPIRIS